MLQSVAASFASMIAPFLGIALAAWVLGPCTVSSIVSIPVCGDLSLVVCLSFKQHSSFSFFGLSQETSIVDAGDSSHPGVLETFPYLYFVEGNRNHRVL